MPSLKKTAELLGKSPSTLHRWRRTHPHLYRAAVEYAQRYYALDDSDARAWDRLINTEARR